MPSVFVVLAPLLWSATAGGESIMISNKYLRVLIDPEANSFSVKAERQNKDFLRQGRFASKILSGQKRTVLDSVWGLGQEIRVLHKNGWESTLRLFGESQFVQIHTIVHNKNSKAYVVSNEELLEFEVDLGLPSEKLKSYGTGFLNPVGKAPGSFAFTAVVDPETRNGVVAACLTHDLGSGVFFTAVKNGRVIVKARMDFGRYQVDAGKSRKPIHC